MTLATVRIGFDGLHVAVRSPAAEALAAVERTFRAMLIPGDSASDPPPVAWLEIDRVGDGFRLAGSGVAPPECGSLEEVRRAVRYHATRAFLEAPPERFWVHAAAACRGTRALLVPGARGRGKSTLVTALARAGWRYLSDEAVPLDMADDRAVPFPLTPHVRVGPGVDLAPEAVAALGKRDVMLAPSAICREAVRITEVVFVRYRPGVAATLASAAPGEAAIEILESCLNYRHHGPRAVRYVADLVRRIPAARLTFGDVDAAVRVLDSTAGVPA